jgi:hypothetical protein
MAAVSCASSLSDVEDISWIKQDYMLGVSSRSDALTAALAVDKKTPGKADVLTFIGSLYMLDGDDATAEKYYFDAHKACPYYNRAHWGLVNVMRRKRNAAASDFAALQKQMYDTASALTYSPNFERYVFNWDNLSSESTTRLKFAMRFWVRHIDFLYKTKMKLYIKNGFEVMSDVPYYRRIENKRITYKHDNRLWDDVRGIGGNMVLVDSEEMREAAWGVYNLAGHVVTHQFQGAAPNVSACADKLYEGAKARGVFADSYSGFNSWEYLAQGVGYYMWPEGSPKRFGLNRKWLADNDPDLLTFIKNIESTDEVDKIVCPVAL